LKTEKPKQNTKKGRLGEQSKPCVAFCSTLTKIVEKINEFFHICRHFGNEFALLPVFLNVRFARHLRQTHNAANLNVQQQIPTTYSNI
jgi:hypothetical protein